MTVTIVSGPPGAGKTTLSHELAAPDGVHLVSDDFYRYPAAVIAPHLPASKHQNETICRAVCAAAGAFSAGGYRVYIDGVIGPWMLPVVTATLPAFRYVVLMPTAAAAQARIADRPEQPVAPDVIDQMLDTFAQHRDQAAAHYIDCQDDSVSQLAERIRGGDFSYQRR